MMSSSPPLPSCSTLPLLPLSTQISVLSVLFEPCDGLQSLALPLLSSRGVDSYAALIAAVGNQLTSLAESASPSEAKSLDRILNAHPRLGEKRLESVRSSAEQASLNETLDGEERLRELNERYEKTFPGLRYVYVLGWMSRKRSWLINRCDRVFVNGRGRDAILSDICLRIERGDIQMERQQAIKVKTPISWPQPRLTARARQCAISLLIVLKSQAWDEQGWKSKRSAVWYRRPRYFILLSSASTSK